MEEEKNNVENSAEPTGDQAAICSRQAIRQLMRSRQPWCRRSLTNRFLAKNCGVRKKAAAAQKAEAAAQKAREKAEAEAQKARQKEESLAAKLQRRQEKKRIPAGRPPGTRTGNKTALAYRGIRHACDVYCACD